MKKQAVPTEGTLRFRRKPLITALEPRLLLDGAALATAVELSTDVAFQDQAAEAAAADPAPAPAPEPVVEPVVAEATPPDAQPQEAVPVATESTTESTSEATSEATELPTSDTGSSTELTIGASDPLTEPSTTVSEPQVEDATDTSLAPEAVAPTQTRQEVVFVDTQVQDYQTLIDGLGEDAQVHLIDSNSNGLEQIAAALQGQTGLDAIHVYSHGDVGQLNLGSLTLDSANIGEYSDLLAQIGESLNADADLMLYGCYVGADSTGQDFIDEMAELTGADVAASSDLTGAGDQGGDWDLESSSGQIETAAVGAQSYQQVLATPVISQLSDFSYTEDSGAVVVDSNMTISGASDFRGGYIEFSLTGGTTTETLGLVTSGSASTASGVVSIVGSTVYRGTGSASEIIGSVDSTYNGLNGQNLRINFSNAFVNGSFQTGSNGDTVITGWTSVTGRIRLDGSYQIAGQNTPVDGTYAAGNTTGDYSTNGSFTQTTNLSDYAADFAGDLALELNTGASSIDQPFGVIRGPAVYSNGTVTLQVGDQVSFDWKALSGGDAYDAYGYLINVNTGATITILDSTGNNTNQETAWSTNTSTIASGQEGVYRFVFVAGSFDLSGGQYLGGKLMIDNVTVTQANPPGAVTADNITTISRLVTYQNSSQDFASTSRTLTMSANDGTGDPVGSASATITLVKVNDAPSLTGGASLGAVAEDTSTAATVSSLFTSRFSDIDATNAPADTLAGIAVSADASNSTQGSWQYTTDGSTWYDVGSVSTSNALLLPSTASLRFLPSADWNGTPGSLSVHAVDSSFGGSFTSGASRSGFDTTSDGSTSAVSASAVTLSTSVTAVNDAAVFTSSPVTVALSDSTGTDTFSTQSGSFTASDDHSGAPNEDGTLSYGISGGSVAGGSVSLDGTYGTLTVTSATGAYSFVPDATAINMLPAGSALSETFTVTVSDGQGGTTTQLFTVNITPSNDSPIGVADTDDVVEAGGVANGTVGTSATGNVLTNDTDIDSTDTPVVNGAVTLVRESTAGSDEAVAAGTDSSDGQVITGLYGTLRIGADGSYQYVTDESNTDVQALRLSGQTLTDSFVYTFSDLGGLTDHATLSITIDGRNDAPVGNDDAAGAVEQGGVFNASAGSDATGNVLANDELVDGVANGETQTVVAVRTGAESGSGTAGTVGVVLTGMYGSLRLDDDGEFTYVVDDSNAAVQALRTTGQTLTDSFTYTVRDTAGLTDQATLVITIDGRNDNPVAVDDAETAIEASDRFNSVDGVDATGDVLSNDTDVDSQANGETEAVSAVRTGIESGSGDAGTVGSALAGQYGSLTLNADGTFTYAIDDTNPAVQALRISGQTLTDSFTYTVSDTGGLTDQATLTITLDGRNDTPVGHDDTGDAVEQGGVFNAVAGSNSTGNVLTNDTDADSAASGETQTVTAVRTGTEGGSGTAGTVGTVLVGTYGSLQLGSDGQFTYVVDDSNPDVQALRINGQTLIDSFTYTVTDAGGLSDDAQLSITIHGRNDNPVATDDAATAIEASERYNSLDGVDATGDVLANDSDVDSGANGETAAVSAVRTGVEAGSGNAGTVGQALTGQYGSLTLNADGTFTYAIDETNAEVQALRVSGQTLTDSFTYTVSDTGGLTDQATLTITIDGRNDTPVANNDTGTAQEAGGVNNNRAGSNATGNVLTNDTDVDRLPNGEAAVVTGVRAGGEGGNVSGGVGSGVNGSYGRLTINADGSFTYVVDNTDPAVEALRLSGQTLTDTFTYAVTDAGGLTDQATLTITIQGQNDAPVVDLGNIDQTWDFGKPFSLDVGSQFSDVDSAANGEDLQFNVTGLPAGLSYDANTGRITGSPSGIGTFTVTVVGTDRGGLSVSRQFTFEVLPPPVQEPTEPTAPEPPAPLPPMTGPVDDGSPTTTPDTPPSPDGTLPEGPVTDPVTDSGYLPEDGGGTDGLSEQQALLMESAGGGNGNGNAEGNGQGQGDGKDAGQGDGNTGAKPETASKGDGSGSERLLLDEGTTRVTETVNADGKVTSVRASIQVEVGADGQVVFSDAQQKAFDIVGLSVASINPSDGGVTILVADEGRGRDTQFYMGELGDGNPLPNWIKVDPNTGQVTIGNPPAGTDEVTVRVKAIASDGTVRMLDIELNLDELLKRKKVSDGPDVEQAPAAVGFVPLSEQVASEWASHDAYGQRLIALLGDV